MGIVKNFNKSSKLEIFLKNYFDLASVGYYDDNFDGSYCLYFKLENDICVEQRIFIKQNAYKCYTTLALEIKDTEKLDKLCIIVNKVNFEIDYGNFEIDYQKGEIRFKSFYEPIDNIYMEDLDRLIGYPRQVINQYGRGLVEFIS